MTNSLARIPSLIGSFAITGFVLLSIGCSTGGSKSVAEHEVFDTLDTFRRGELRLTCETACSGSWGSIRRKAKSHFENSLWTDLAIDVAQVGHRVDLAYFYLGRAAEGLGHVDAARTYYRLGIANRYKCAGLINNCDGFNVPYEILLGLERLPLSTQPQNIAAPISADSPTTSNNKPSTNEAMPEPTNVKAQGNKKERQKAATQQETKALDEISRKALASPIPTQRSKIIKANSPVNSKTNANDLLELAKNQNKVQNYESALKIYTELASIGNAEALFRLGEMTIDGHGTSKDKDAAYKLFEKAADQNHPYAIDAFYNGMPRLVITKLQPLADEGNPDAQILLGSIYTKGPEHIRDEKTAKKWLWKGTTHPSCNEDQSFILEILGKYYESGINVTVDQALSLSMRKKAAGCGYAPAATSIGKMYFSGNGVEENQEEALVWFRKAIYLGGDSEEKSIGNFLNSKRIFNQLLTKIASKSPPSRYGWRTGMTKEEVQQSYYEKPVRKNKFTSQFGTKEQWVYGNGWAYLYFDEHGILTSYQERETQ